LRMGPGFVDFLDRRRLSFSIKESRGWWSYPHRSSFSLIIICQNLKKVGISENQFIIQCFSSIYLQASFIDVLQIEGSRRHTWERMTLPHLLGVLSHIYIVVILGQMGQATMGCNKATIGCNTPLQTQGGSETLSLSK
jgi:hypothetical protein